MIELRAQVESLGDRVLGAVDVAGEFFLLGVQTVRAAFRGEFPVHETMVQFDALVVRSECAARLPGIAESRIAQFRRPAKKGALKMHNMSDFAMFSK
ncbi:MAG: hypothetical protein IID34_03505 [Planctomycetes bacterium]|nr:hypothetical protein [Planctomycetota bacterium]